MSTASRQIWPWRDQEPGAREALRATRLRRRGLIPGLVVLILGTVLNKVFGHALAGRVLVALGAVQVLVALWRPLWLGPVQRGLGRFGELVGRGLAWLLLGALWLLVFVPGGLLLRVLRRDPLHRAPLAPGRTAWIPRRQRATTDACERQFLIEDRAARALDRPEGALPDAALLADLVRERDGGSSA